MVHTRSATWPRLAVVCLGLALFAPPGDARIYQWVDEEGNTHVSEQPPPSGIVAEEYSAPPPPDSAHARKLLEEQRQQSDARRKEAAQEEAKHAEEASVAAKDEADCAAAQRRLASVQRPRVDRKQEDGTWARLGEEERMAAVAAAKQYLQDNGCS